MAQSNLAREPSMDEILASIRKIIESNEATGPGLPANDQRPASDGFYADEHPYLEGEEAEDIHLTIDDNVFPDFENPIETEQRVMPVLAYAVEEPKPAVPPAPLSLADVAARVRAASERQSYPRDAQQQRETEARDFPARTQAAPRRDVPVMTDNPVVAPADVPQRRPDMPTVAAEVRAPAGEMRHADVPQATAASMPVTEAATPAPLAPEPVAAQAQTPAPLPAPVPEKETTAILSDAVSEQVSRSFGELALAVDSGSRRSFDEIAEDMLRPMLQDWLDDNLPTLVERLVREEIERVARGPRR